MALGSWQGLYNTVIDELMEDDREQELLLLMAIARHADFLGFCFPGKARLMKMRHVGEKLYEQRLTFLVKRCLVSFEMVYDVHSRGRRPLFQVSPRVLYVREEFQEYCEKVFDGVEERNFRLEEWWGQNNLSLRDSQPETEPETEPESVTRRKNQTHIQTQNQRGTTPEQKGLNGTTMRSGDQRKAQGPARSATDRDSAQKKQPPDVGVGPDEFDALMDVDEDRMTQEVRHIVTTTEHQAQKAVQTYPRDALIHWLRITAHRRQRQELSSPAGWFFKTLKAQVKPITYQDIENDHPGHMEDF